MKLPWLNESYVHLNVTNKTLFFSVGALKNSIVESYEGSFISEMERYV